MGNVECDTCSSQAEKLILILGAEPLTHASESLHRVINSVKQHPRCPSGHAARFAVSQVERVRLGWRQALEVRNFQGCWLSADLLIDFVQFTPCFTCTVYACSGASLIKSH